MILGFLSLLLTFGQTYILRICISQTAADKMLPCAADGTNDSSSRRRLLSYQHRFLAEDSSSSTCKQVDTCVFNSPYQNFIKLTFISYNFPGLFYIKSLFLFFVVYKGYEPLVSVNGLHQLHILIFFLAVFHVLYSAVTMLLGRLKVLSS